MEKRSISYNSEQTSALWDEIHIVGQTPGLTTIIYTTVYEGAIEGCNHKYIDFTCQWPTLLCQLNSPKSLLCAILDSAFSALVLHELIN